MEDAAEILVIILSCVLTIFLIVMIIVMTLAIKLIKQLRRIADKAEHAVASVESATEILKNTSGQLAAFKLVQNIVKHFKK